MRRPNVTLFVTVTLIATCLYLAGPVGSQETGPLDVQESAICLEVVDRSCVDGNTVFPVGIGKLSCFTRVTGSQGHTDIDHVWYFGEVERARVTLRIGSANWRTFSSKVIQPHEIGDWRVDIVGPGGDVLTAVKFEVVE